jgi:hypothetical protein
MDYRGLPIQTPPNIHPFHVAVFNQSIRVLYKGSTNVAFNLTQVFGTGIYCSAAVFYKWQVNWGGDYINATFMYL